MSTPSEAKRREFAHTMSEILNHGALNLAMGVGYRLGLFDVLCRLAAPASVSQIAEAAALDPRYIREWLGVMTCGRIVELSHDTNGEDLFFLPPEHAAFLTRDSSSNMGVYTQELPLLAQSAYDAVAAAFATGEGVGYERYPDFQAFMAQLANAKHEQTLLTTFLPSVAQGAIQDRLHHGIRVCDVGCGQGTAVLLMAEAFPHSTFVGLDIDNATVDLARKTATARGLTNVRFVCQDAAVLEDAADWQNCFDYVTAFDAIHDQPHPDHALRGVRHMLAPNGVFSLVDIAAESDLAGNQVHPMGPFLYTVSLMHCMPVGLVGNGAGLGMMWGRQTALRMLETAGFTQVTVREIPEDPFNHHFECRSPS